MIVLHNNIKVRVSYLSTDHKFLLVSYAKSNNESLFKINFDDLDLKSDKKRIIEKSNIYIPEGYFAKSKHFWEEEE